MLPIEDRRGRGWEATAPLVFEVVTGFFPETKPKPTWATNPRPLLVCGVATDDEAGEHFVRVAYGTKNVSVWSRRDLCISNLSMLNDLNLPHPTRFVLDAASMVILPWTPEHFRPWRQFATPRIGRLEEGLQRFAAGSLAEQADTLPQF